MLISIALATYNGEFYLREQLNSILNQTFSDWELVVGDDGSTDSTLDILKEYSQKDSRISFFKNSSNLGFKNNFGKIFSHCSGEFIACCDQDDIWTKDHLEFLLKNIGNNDCIGANAIICNSNLKSTGKTTLDSKHIERSYFDNSKLFVHECYYNLIQGTASLFKSSLLNQIMPFPNTIAHHDHWIALNASISSGCTYTPYEVLYYRTHENNAVGITKFSLRHSLKTLVNIAKHRSSMYDSRLAMLQELQSKNLLESQKTSIQAAMSFFKNLKENKNRIKETFYFIRNYKAITLSSYKNFGYFLYRVINLALFGIML